MKKKNFLIFIPLLFFPFISSSCNSDLENNKLIELIEKISLTNELTKNQLLLYLNNYLINNDYKNVFLKIENNSLVINNKNYALSNNLKLKSYSSSTVENNSYVIKKNSDQSTDLNILFNFLPDKDFNQEEYLNNLWTIHNSNDYNSVLYNLPNLQYFLYLAANNNPLKITNKNKLNSMRNIAFLNSNKQKNYFLLTLNFYLNEYRFVYKNKIIKQILFNDLILDKNDIKVQFSFLDEDNKIIKFHEYFYLTNFIDYAKFYPNLIDKKSKQSISLNLLDKNVSVTNFSEEVNNPTIKFKDNLFNLVDFDSLMHPNSKYLEFNLNGFKYLVDNFKDYMYITDANNDTNYEIENFEITNLLNDSYAIGKMLVKDTKTNKYYNWYSINFTPHHHLFNGFYIENELNLLDKKNKNNYWSYSNLEIINGNVNYPRAINADSFFDDNLLTIMNFLIEKNINNLQLWNNKNMYDFSDLYVINNKKEIEKKLSLIFSQFVLLYFIKKNDSLIREVKVEIDPENDFYNYKNELGTIPFKVDFIDYNNKSMLSDRNRNKIFILKGFLGTDFSDIEKAKNERRKNADNEYLNQPIYGKTLPYIK
ncbi:MAG3240 family lipoprotein [Mycoplasmopsis meleagridis]|uniref:MAG3240 family lipoprotein n=1 Tax=Mycoplasmopsis meleagridis TaxID=29561 RepID=UPI003A8982FE